MIIYKESLFEYFVQHYDIGKKKTLALMQILALTIPFIFFSTLNAMSYRVV